MLYCRDPMAIEEIIKFWKCNYNVCSVFIDISVQCGRVLKAFSCLYYQFCYTMHNQYVFAFCLIMIQLLLNCVECQKKCILQSHCVSNIFGIVAYTLLSNQWKRFLFHHHNWWTLPGHASDISKYLTKCNFKQWATYKPHSVHVITPIVT